MSDWRYMQENPAEQLALLHQFSVQKLQDGKSYEFRILIKEFAVPPPGQHLRFFAESDKAVNQAAAPFVPCGWGSSLYSALADCVRLIRQFPYDDAHQESSGGKS